MLRKGSEIGSQALPSAAAQIGEPFAVIQKAAPQDLGDAEVEKQLVHSVNNVPEVLRKIEPVRPLIHRHREAVFLVPLLLFFEPVGDLLGHVEIQVWFEALA